MSPWIVTILKFLVCMWLGTLINVIADKAYHMAIRRHPAQKRRTRRDGDMS